MMVIRLNVVIVLASILFFAIAPSTLAQGGADVLVYDRVETGFPLGLGPAAPPPVRVPTTVFLNGHSRRGFLEYHCPMRFIENASVVSIPNNRVDLVFGFTADMDHSVVVSFDGHRWNDCSGGIVLGFRPGAASAGNNLKALQLTKTTIYTSTDDHGQVGDASDNHWIVDSNPATGSPIFPTFESDAQAGTMWGLDLPGFKEPVGLEHVDPVTGHHVVSVHLVEEFKTWIISTNTLPHFVTFGYINWGVDVTQTFVGGILNSCTVRMNGPGNGTGGFTVHGPDQDWTDALTDFKNHSAQEWVNPADQLLEAVEYTH